MRRVFPIIALWVAMVFAAIAPAFGAMDRAEKEQLLSEGNELFRKANAAEPAEAAYLYRQAVMRFERLAREGEIRNGRLYYNIGNAYFRLNDIGRAILYYRMAERLIPNDANLAQNLKEARARRADRVDSTQARRVLEILFFWHYDLTSAARSVLFAVFFVLLWVCAIARIFIRRAFMGWITGLSAAVAAVLFVSLLIGTISSARDRYGVIIAPEIMARKGDGEAFAPSFNEPLHAGTEFTLKEIRGEWMHIRLADGRECWLQSSNAELIR